MVYVLIFYTPAPGHSARDRRYEGGATSSAASAASGGIDGASPSPGRAAGETPAETQPRAIAQQFRVVRPLDDEDVYRVRYYAKFVLSMKLWKSDADLSANDLQQVHIALREQTLFPNLRVFEYEGPSEFTPYLPSILVTSVTDMKLYYNFGCDLDMGLWTVRPEDIDYSDDRDAILAIKERQPRAPITTLLIFISMPLPEFLRPILTGWDELEDLTLETHCVDPPMFMMIAALPHLKNLEMPAVSGLDRPCVASRSACTSNYTLRSLRLYGLSVAEMISIIRPISLSTLEAICGVAASAFQDIGMRIREAGVPASLQDMTLAQHVLHPHPEQEPDAYWREALRIQHIIPFFFNKSLVHVRIIFQTIAFSDDDMAILAQAWPRLQSLTLLSEGSTDVPVALSSMLAFARYCPDLTYLLLSVDATRITVPNPSNIPFPRAHERLSVLHVEDSPISSPARVASFLTRFFPNARPKVGLKTRMNDATRERLWLDVLELIPILLDARMTGIHGGVTVKPK
ncbi:uncharacterized protein SCHCODRAFT_02693449 [Schizophyllum commune H4-8]|uniref:uncharacterized protein n=1 Tax=Schizophyllum commune (strain H4-8 / FGSC 9210) TaxID=578458 RepID=UPI00215E9321|nr:uncharacterized protein SCHCODRAFT_02693449 [Schizophyllum commune H4-8]KAI5885867.1 hypothetical protein SCHCODRAFT_02693449 [Schizophyllum commune H4-8]